MPRARLAELVTAAAYGSVLVLASLSVISVSDVAAGHGAELVAGVGGATWIAHLFAELLGGHVHDPEPLRRSVILQAMADGGPILAATVLPAVALVAGRLDLITDRGARAAAIAVAVAQLLSIGIFVGQVTPTRPGARWTFAVVTTGVGVAVVAVTVLLGH